MEKKLQKTYLTEMNKRYRWFNRIQMFMCQYQLPKKVKCSFEEKIH